VRGLRGERGSNEHRHVTSIYRTRWSTLRDRPQPTESADGAGMTWDQAALCLSPTSTFNLTDKGLSHIFTILFLKVISLFNVKGRGLYLKLFMAVIFGFYGLP
jgi:hypothetical protein